MIKTLYFNKRKDSALIEFYSSPELYLVLSLSLSMPRDWLTAESPGKYFLGQVKPLCTILKLPREGEWEFKKRALLKSINSGEDNLTGQTLQLQKEEANEL